MMMTKLAKKLTMTGCALVLALTVFMQPGTAQGPYKQPAKASEPAKAPPPAAAHDAAAKGEHGEAKPAEGEAKKAEADPHAQFTQSPSVKWIAEKFGLKTKQAYWMSVIFNFLVVLFLIWFFSKTGVPKMFRDRSAAIQRGLEEARKASAESAVRLTGIEARLGRLNEDIAAMRAQSEGEAKAEADRLRAMTEEEKRKIVQSAEQEIAAASNNARRELKNLAAELAVSLAEKKITVNEETDKTLVREFASSLSNTGAKGRS